MKRNIDKKGEEETEASDKDDSKDAAQPQSVEHEVAHGSVDVGAAEEELQIMIDNAMDGKRKNEETDDERHASALVQDGIDASQESNLRAYTYNPKAAKFEVHGTLAPNMLEHQPLPTYVAGQPK